MGDGEGRGIGRGREALCSEGMRDEKMKREEKIHRIKERKAKETRGGEDARCPWRKQRQKGEKKGSALFITPSNYC